MKAYSAEFRGEVLAACDAGGGTREVATRFRVSESWVRRIKQERRELGKIAPCKTRDREKKWEAHAEEIRRKVQDAPETTVSELKERLKAKLSRTTLWRAMRSLQLTWKKKS